MQVNGLPLADETKTERTAGNNVVTRIPTAAAAGFGCPCHGGQYDTEGNRTAGPPVARARPLRVRDRRRPPAPRQDVRGLRRSTGPAPTPRSTRTRSPARASTSTGPRPGSTRCSRPADGEEEAEPPRSAASHRLLYPLDWLEERLDPGPLGARRRDQVLPLPQGPERHQLGAHARLGDADRVHRAGGHRRDPRDVLQAGSELRRTSRSGTSRTTSRSAGSCAACTAGARASSSSCCSCTWARVFLFGAYKYPRELNWIIGALILVLGMIEGFFGYLLPWDQTAYWATVVGVNLQRRPGPFVGPFLGAGPPGRARRSGPTRWRASTRCTCSCSRARSSA